MSITCFKYLFYLVYGVFVINSSTLDYDYGYQIVKLNDSHYGLKYDNTNFIRVLPDQDTAKLFGLNLNNISTINFQNSNILDDPVDSLILRPSSTPRDEKMRVTIKLILASYVNNSFWNKIYFIDNCFNPSVIKIQNKYLIGYRYLLNYIKFSWLHHNLSSLHKTANYYNLTDSIDNYGESNRFEPYNRIRHDPRILLLSNTSLLILYSNYVGKFRHGMYKQYYFQLNIHLNNQSVTFSETYMLNITDKSSMHHKNWVPFVYNQQIYFIITIFPFHIAKLSETYNINNLYHNVETIVDYEDNNTLSYPWLHEFYGIPRGSTDFFRLLFFLSVFFRFKLSFS